MQEPQPYQRLLNAIAILFVGGLGVALLIASNNEGGYLLRILGAALVIGILAKFIAKR